MVQAVSPLLGSESSDVSALPEEMIVLHLIATGIIKRATKIELGEEVNGDYEIPLQLGLDRLNVLRYTQAVPLIKSVPNLLAWCRKPLREWLPGCPAMLDPDDYLLSGPFPTELCQDLACVASDVEAELSERHFIEQVFNICQGASDPQAYADFRRLLIEKPVMTALELLQCCQLKPSLEILRDLLPQAYESAPLDFMVKGNFFCCPVCGNLQQPNYEQTQFSCENGRCRRQAAKGTRGRVIAAQEQVYWLKRGQRNFIAHPGLVELRLEKRLIGLGIEVEMWPEFDSYDLRVKLPRKTLAVDVKDWANPFLLARKVQEKGFPLSPAWDEAYFIFPKERKREQPDYVRAFTNTCNSSNGRVRIGKKIKATFEDEFVKVVQKELDGKGVSDANER
jgi:REase associating with pPIWI_RE/pPIWI_RE three-gene island domain Y